MSTSALAEPVVAVKEDRRYFPIPNEVGNGVAFFLFHTAGDPGVVLRVFLFVKAVAFFRGLFSNGCSFPDRLDNL